MAGLSARSIPQPARSRCCSGIASISMARPIRPEAPPQRRAEGGGMGGGCGHGAITRSNEDGRIIHAVAKETSTAFCGGNNLF